MADVVSAAKRSEMMSGIRGANTRPEITVRKLLFALGYRFRLHRRDLPGSPDVVMSSRKVAIFVQGCFWHWHHGCRYAKLPSTRPDFWKTKLGANVARDKATTAQLRSIGWRTLWVWECALRDAATQEELSDRMQTWIEGSDAFGEIASATSNYL